MTISRLIPKPIKKRLIRAIYLAKKPYEIRISNEPELHGKIAAVTGGSGTLVEQYVFSLVPLAQLSKYVVGQKSPL